MFVLSLTIKLPVKELERTSVCDKVMETLRSDPHNAYTLMGLLVVRFEVKEHEILGKPFSQWRKGIPSLYGKIKWCLDRAVNENRVIRKKRGKAVFYWWNAKERPDDSKVKKE